MTDTRPGADPGATGVLHLVATPIGNLGDLSPRAAATLASADLVCCEDTRRTRVLLDHAGVRARRLVSLHAHNEAARTGEVLTALSSGASVALVSDAGTPLVSDPGERIVAAVLDAGHAVTAVPGPSAALCALVLSGFSTARFVFEGFLPRRGAERSGRLATIATCPAPSIVYEAPGRVLATVRDLAARCTPGHRIVVARELTKLFEEIWRGTLAEAVAHLESSEPRGEYVLVLGPAPESDDGALDLDAALASLFDAGLGTKDAVAALVALLGVRHRDAYARALALRSSPAVATRDASPT